MLGVRHIEKYAAATEILNQAFIAKRPANEPKKEPVRPVHISWKKNVIVHIIPLRILSIALVFR